MNYKYMYLSFQVLLTCAYLTSCGVEKPSSKMLSAWKVARADARLRPVHENWKIAKYDAREGYVDWADYSSSNAGDKKQLHFNGSTPIWEEDYYYSGRQFRSADGESMPFEFLTLHYDFETKRCAIVLTTDNEALAAKVSEEMRYKGVDIDTAYSVVDPILHSWGLNHN